MSIGTLCVLLKPIVWFFCEIGHWVKGLSEGWSEKVARKPPDPETNKVVRNNRRKKRQRLSKAVSLIMTLPMIVNPANARLIAGMARKICTGNWMPNEAATLHDLLRATNNQALIASISGIFAIVDTGCTAISTFDKSDFLPGTFLPAKHERSIGGIGGSLPIKGTGKVKYEVLDDFGRIKYLQGDCHLVEGLPVRLIPPQCIMKNRDDGYYSINGQDGGQFVFKCDGGVIKTPIDLSCNLPMVTMFHDATKASEDMELSLYSCVTKENNQNLSPTQKEMLRWHARLGHPSMAIVRWIGKRGLLGKWGTKVAFSQAEDPKCATCQYGKQVRRSVGSTHTQLRSEAAGGLQYGKLNPGDQVATDQFEVTKRGRKFNTSGREKDTEKFVGGTIFVDVSSGLTKIYFQVSLGSSETLMAKQSFERFALSCGVSVKSYRTDNGIFTKEQFLNEIIENSQSISCSGVGAHHQNGIAERAIRTHVTKARTILLHAMLRWPEQTSSDLWPMAMQHSEHLVNIIPDMSDGFSPEEKFCRSFKTTAQLEHLPVWGCPTYVLDPTLQDGRKIPKWNSRSRRGQFLGWSPLHASNVALVRNLNTGRISPQFHVVFDNWFETVYCDEGEEEPPIWDIIVTNSTFTANIDPEDIVGYEIDDEWLTKEEINERRARHRSSIGAAPRSNEAGAINIQKPSNDHVNALDLDPPSFSISSPNFNPVVEGTNTEFPMPSNADISEAKSTKESPFHPTTTPVVETRKRRQSEIRSRQMLSPGDNKTSLRRSMRQRQAPQRLGYDGTGVAGYMELVDFIRKRRQEDIVSAECMVAYWTMLNTDPRTGYLEDFEPAYTDLAFKAAKRKTGNPDTPNYREAMSGEHREAFKKAMEHELQGLADKGTWHAMLRSAVPKDAKVIPLTWVFRIKRLPNGEFSKFKARICVRGDLQEETRETYAPVVRWTTIRSVLAFAVKHKLKTRQIDFENAFVQSELPVDEEVYVECPPGFGHHSDPGNTVLKLQKSLYGMVRAPYLWFQTLKTSLNALGFESSMNDQCLFINKEKRMIVLVYTDDCLCFAWEDEHLDDLVNGLKSRGHILDEQSITNDVYAYLGIELNMQGNIVEMTQKGLTNKILKTVGMENCNTNETPAKAEPLSADKDGKPFREAWDMSSVVGMLMYLVHTRPDIQFAVHQCAKFTHNPKECHAIAVKKICRYLAGTKDRGLCFKANPTNPDQLLRVDCYVDASFAPLWDIEDPTNPDGAKSRSGYMIRIDDCPIAFASRKQGETAMSTTEAEYMALSMAMRELLWVRRMVGEVAEGLAIPYDKKSRILSKVFEDNQGAIAVANRPDLTTRTRHLHTKYHHFKENIGVDEHGNGIEIVYIDTKKQIADIFTKGLGNDDFKRLRNMLMGWNLNNNNQDQNDGGFKGELNYSNKSDKSTLQAMKSRSQESGKLCTTAPPKRGSQGGSDLQDLVMIAHGKRNVFKAYDTRYNDATIKSDTVAIGSVG